MVINRVRLFGEPIPGLCFAIVLPIVPTLADAEDAPRAFLRYKVCPAGVGQLKVWLGRIVVNCATILCGVTSAGKIW